MKKAFYFLFITCCVSITSFAQNKPLSIICNKPTSLKAGQSTHLKVIVKHEMATEKTGTLSLNLLNHQTGKSVDGWFLNIFPFQYFTTIKNENFEVDFPFTVPHEYKGKLDIELVAHVDQFKDSTRYTIPIQDPK